MPKARAKTGRTKAAPWHKQPELTPAEKVPDLPMEEYQAIIDRQMREQFAQENAPAPAARRRSRSRSVHWDKEVVNILLSHGSCRVMIVCYMACSILCLSGVSQS